MSVVLMSLGPSNSCPVPVCVAPVQVGTGLGHIGIAVDPDVAPVLVYPLLTA